jgi:Flp pilus assembly protein TadD
MAHLSYLNHRLGQTREATVILEKILSKGSERPELYGFLASLYGDQGHFDKALATLDRGLTVFPQESGLLYHKGVTLDRNKDRVQAIEVMREVINASPDHAEALNFLAYSFAEDDVNLDEALELSRRAFALKPEGHIMDTLGWVFYKLERFEEARQQLEKAIEMMPEDPVVQQHLGDAYRELRLFDKARATYLKVLELTPEDADVRIKLDGLGRHSK